ncbi:serine/threonine-protein kinase [Sorangium cellulosum]|uniref:serine/threonine-protein kinase n=1 Tax=Sorangium cellulosum TaxID=56 RepID=UPI003D9A8DE3
MAAPVAVGDVLAGKYRVEQIVGAGAMGMIVAAWHLELDQRVAMKFLHSPGTDTGGGDPAERFRREARALARIKSEHVARVLDVGSLQAGLPYMVMEFLDGNNLSDEIRARGQLPVMESVGYMLQAIEAMAEAHAAGIVHRDLKPANLFLARRPDGERIIKVLDFGISKALLGISRDELSLTKTATLLGSPLYMSPEQVRSAREVDARADIWSLGVIFYEMLTGRTPYNGDSVPQLFSALLYESPFTVAQIRPDVPHDLDAAVMHCLAKERDQRWRNVGDLAAALLAFGPPGSHVHAERARRVLGLQDAGGSRPSLQSQPSLPPGAMHGSAHAAGARLSAPHIQSHGGPHAAGARASMAPGGTQGGAHAAAAAGARPSLPHGAPSPASAAETGPTVNSWSNTGQLPRAGRKGAAIGIALAGSATLAAVAIAAVLLLRSGPPAGGEQPAAPAAELPPGTAAPGPAREAAPEPAKPAAAEATAPAATAGASAPEATAGATAAAATAAPPAASSASARPPAASATPGAAPAGQPGTPAARPAERPQPGPAARPEPRRDNEISDFGGRR